jgi:hypothetical protein
MNSIPGKTIFALLIVAAVSATQIAAVPPDGIEEWWRVADVGNGAEQIAIGSPPPWRLDYAPAAAVDVPEPDAESGINNLIVPALYWYMGCSATSAAMIAGYYDRNGYPDMYTGPANGGYFPMPTDSTTWGTFTDIAGDTYALCPLTGSRLGLDGRTTRGSADDYWIEYGSAADDPFITNGWVEHAWGSAIGDYMKTSQSWLNHDGTTKFHMWSTSPGETTCDEMVTEGWSEEDGTYGRKLYYEARGYTVTDCYNEKTDNAMSGGFSFADYMAEIDAGHPVLINLEGHSIVGTGYNTADETVYLRDTWDWSTHSMTWGGCYGGPPAMCMHDVSIVHLADTLPVAFEKAHPADGGIEPTGLWLNWNRSPNADNYYYCLDTVDNGICDTAWVNNGAGLSAELSGLGNNETYHWSVVAYNDAGYIYADGGTWWSFTARNQIFADVPIDHTFWMYIEAFYSSGITGGCGFDPLIFCPSSNVTRAAMAVFLLRAKYGSGYAPPAARHFFADLPVAGKEWQEAWVDQLYAEGITGGCGAGPLIYCPENPVTRAAMAVFVLRTLEGSSYTPPPATHFFTDMPVAGKEWMEPWVDEVYRRGITTGCGTGPLIYCPETAVKRQTMAVFLVRAFNLPLP